MKATLAVLLLVGSVTAGAAELPPGFVPVAPGQVSGRTLTAADGSFTVDAPADDWLWARLPAAEQAVAQMHPELRADTFFAIQPATRVMFIFTVAHEGNDQPPNDLYMKGVGSGIERTSPKTGWQISNYSFSPSPIPFAGSYRFSCIATNNAGVVKHRFGYLGGTSPKFHFECSVPGPGEPELFAAFVRSLHVGAAKSGG